MIHSGAADALPCLDGFQHDSHQHHPSRCFLTTLISRRHILYGGLAATLNICLHSTIHRPPSTMDQYSASDFDEENIYNESFLRRPRFVDLRSTEAELFNQLLECHVPDQVVRWDCCGDTGWEFELEDLVINVKNTISSPVKVQVTSGSMPQVFIDPLRQELRRILSTALVSNDHILNFAVTLLQFLEEAVISIHEWKVWQNRVKTEKKNRGKKKIENGWNVNEVKDIQVLFDNPLGADLDTVDESAFHLLGKSVKDICENFSNLLILNKYLQVLPYELRILHVEPVCRTDLIHRFLKRRNRMMDQLMGFSYRELRKSVPFDTVPRGSALDNKVDLARELCRPRVTFHGTSRHKVSSIVRWGFVIPGTKAGSQKIGVKYGSSFGRGIYSSPDASYALFYSNLSDEGYKKTRAEELPGLRLIISAVLMGRALQVTRAATRGTTEIADEKANSHVSPNKCEYVVFDPAQIIPCYVVHLDFGVEAAREWLKQAPEDPSAYERKTRLHPKLVKQDLFPAETEALKQAKKAAASKWFPYGYGPAKGNSFVIEEIGEVSDDEEDYGEYQVQRQEVGDEVRMREKERAQAGSWFDEYQKSRREEVKVKKELDDEDDDS
jgi:hypothetical protein